MKTFLPMSNMKNTACKRITKSIVLFALYVHTYPSGTFETLNTKINTM